jgi:AbrB family looped-hinge helix DNA binding protein
METQVLQIRSNGQITLPASVRRQANLTEGDLLEVFVSEDGTLCLKPKVAIDRSQAWFWTTRWQKGELATEEDLKQGRVKDFDSIEDLLDDLNSGQ